MNIIRAMVDVKLSIEQVNEINELIVRDEALPVLENEVLGDEWHRCPRCKHAIFRKPNFCEQCGQRLDNDNIEL